jgi:APA family basic amino acid/polyamine antiporter
VLGAGLTLSFENLLVLTNVLTLGIFCMVDLALWRVHRSQRIDASSFTVPRWLPPAAAAVSLILVLAELAPLT